MRPLISYALAFLLAFSSAGCGEESKTQPSSSLKMPYSPEDLLVTQEEQLALTRWCEENSVLRELNCELEVAKVALAVGFRESRGDERCWVELFGEKITGRFAGDSNAYESRVQYCTGLDLVRVDE